jgi:hypothetical protein
MRPPHWDFGLVQTSDPAVAGRIIRGLKISALGFVLFVALVAPLFAHDGTQPDPRLTPGEVRTTDRAAICEHSTREVRTVSVAAKVAARRAYGLRSASDGWCAGGCEIDHRLPLGVGGDNRPGSIANLWPQRPDGPHGYRVKDVCESAVHRDLCAGRLTVAQAQAVFLGDWTVNCRPWVPGLR